MCNAYEQDRGELPFAFSEVRIRLKTPDDGDGGGLPREAYPRLNGRFLRRATEDPAGLYDLEEMHGRFGLVDEAGLSRPGPRALLGG